MTNSIDTAALGMEISEMLGSILKAIQKGDQIDDIKSLAKTGACLAADYHNIFDCMREEVEGAEEAQKNSPKKG